MIERPVRVPGIPDFFGDSKEHLRKTANAVNGVLLGRVNNVIKMTLETGEAATVFASDRITSQTVVVFSPMSQAAAQLAGVYAGVEAGKLTLFHPIGATGQVFGVAFFA